MTDIKRLCIKNEMIYIMENQPFYQSVNSKIYKANDNKFKRPVAVKEVNIAKYNHKTIMDEININCKLSNYTSQIPVILNYEENHEKLFIVMQWIEGKTLKEKIESNITNKQKLEYAKDLCKIIGIFHDHKYEHRDLKPENILIGLDDRLNIIDFNISTQNQYRGQGTDNYRAPEIDYEYDIRGKGYGLDVFAIGAILYYLFTKHIPKPYVDYEASYGEKEWKTFTEPIIYNPNLNDKLNDIIVKCMKYNPKDRYINAKNILFDLKKVRLGKIYG